VATTTHWLATIFWWTLGAGPVLTLIVWVLVWERVERSMRAVPTLRAWAALAAAEPPAGSVCVVVPAYNEAATIGGLIRSLRAQTHLRLAVVLALDRCTDDTAAVARAAVAGDPRFEIVEIAECPDDWAGKVHAVHVGVARSRAAAAADYLLFADADTEFDPACIAASLALMRARDLDLLSLLSTLRYTTWFERVVQTAAAFELMRQYPLVRANAQDQSRRAFANGQYMLFRRAAYDAVGGHEAVHGALLEDLALARRIAASGRRAGVFLAAGLLHCRMYADWPAFRRGWKRIYTEAANRKVHRLKLAALRIRWLGTLLPAWTLAAAAGGAIVVATGAPRGGLLLALALAALVLWLAVLTRVTVLSRAPAWTAPLHIAGAWLTANLLAEAAADLERGRPTVWGGREYDLGADKT
jgi:glycosyltransferase involved in cell wall biosynthesis